MPFFDDELNNTLPDNYWQTLNSYEYRQVCTHTINVFYRSLRDHLYINQFSKYEQNILKWAVLLHDICKR